MIPRLRSRAAVCAAALALMAPLPASAQETIPVSRIPVRDQPLAGTAAHVWTVGTDEGREWEMFSGITGLAFDARENLYVLDRGAGAVRVFDAEGRFVRQIGRRGNGPGELMQPLQLTVAPDGRVFVTDVGRMAYSVFGPDGTFDRNLPFPSAQIRGLGGPAAVWHPQGGLVALAAGLNLNAAEAGDADATPLEFLPVDGGTPRKLYDVRQSRPRPQAQSASGTRRFQLRQTTTYGPSVLLGVTGDGVTALAYTPGYTIRLLDANGRTLRYLQRPVPVRRTTEADREAARQRMRDQMANVGRGGSNVIVLGGGGGSGGNMAPPRMDPQTIEDQVARLVFADTVAALRGMYVAPSGKLWVERTPADFADPTRPGPVDLLTVDGRYLGTTTEFRLPRAVSRGGLTAWIERDDMDVERIVVRRLPPAWR